MNSHKVFVYGSLKRRGSNHDFLKGATFLGVGATGTSEFRMHNLGSFPGITMDRAGNGSFILGELYEVDSSTLQHLDRLEGIPVLYTRESITVQLVNEAHENVWVYVLNSRVMRALCVENVVGEGRVRTVNLEGEDSCSVHVWDT